MLRSLLVYEEGWLENKMQQFPPLGVRKRAWLCYG